jgi:hypothetical protein
MTVALGQDVVMSEVDGGVVLLDSRSGRYWHLNATAAAMLTDLLDGCSPEQAAARIVDGSDAAADQVQADLLALVAGLRQARLVTA